MYVGIYVGICVCIFKYVHVKLCVGHIFLQTYMCRCGVTTQHEACCMNKYDTVRVCLYFLLLSLRKSEPPTNRCRLPTLPPSLYTRIILTHIRVQCWAWPAVFGRRPSQSCPLRKVAHLVRLVTGMSGGPLRGVPHRIIGLNRR